MICWEIAFKVLTVISYGPLQNPMKKAGSKSHHIHDLFGINLEQTENRKDQLESERD